METRLSRIPALPLRSFRTLGEVLKLSTPWSSHLYSVDKKSMSQAGGED